jgi:hypothetical protein
MAAKKKTKKKPAATRKAAVKKSQGKKLAKAKAIPKKKSAKKKVAGKVAGSRKGTSANAKSAGKKSASTKALARRARTYGSLDNVVTFSKENSRARSGGQSGDTQGLTDLESSNSESVDELLEEGNTFEAEAVAGVEHADDADEKEVHTHEVPEDDVPQEYLDRDE